MQDSAGRFEVMFRLPCAISRAAKMLTALSLPWALACAGGPDLYPFTSLEIEWSASSR